MKDRRNLQEEMNRINELYQKQDLELRKAGGTDMQRQQLRDMLNAKKERLIMEYGDDAQKLNIGGKVKLSNATISKGIDQSKLPDMSEVKNLGKEGMFKRIGKKVAGVIPLAGAAYGLASGDPAMAAEEAVGDLPVVGQVYDAIKPEAAGNEEEEKMMLAEERARRAYKNSPAARDKAVASEDEVELRKQALKGIRGY